MLATLRKCLDLLPRRSRRSYLLLTPLSLLTGLAEMGATAGIFGYITWLTSPVEGHAIPWLAALTRHLPWQTPGAIVLQLTGLLALLYVARSAVVLASQYFRLQVAHAANAGLSCDLLRRYLTAAYPFHFGRHSSDLIRNCTTGVEQALGSLFYVSGFITDLVMALGMLAVLLATSPAPALLIGVVLAGGVLAFLRLTRVLVASFGRGRHELAASVLRSLQQSLGGVKELKVLGRERYFYDAYAAQQREALRVRRLGVTLESVPGVILQTALICGALGLVGALTIWGQSGVESVPLAAVFGYVGMRLLSMANGIVTMVSHIRSSGPAVDALHEDVIALGAAEPPLVAAPIEFKHAIVLENVSYTYPSATQPAIRNASLTVARGESVGIIGETGAGKSTLVDVILGLLPPTQGRITVDGVDLARAAVAWKRRVGYVPQSIYLTDDTLQRNIALGIPDDEIDPERIRSVVAAGQLERFVAALPRGLDTPVGERGIRLSGGERQRVAIARALYHDPDVLILDEATASLDVQTEAEITRTIRDLHALKTVIVVAHRLSSVRNCDRLIWLAEGRVTDAGAFDDLLRRRTDFQALVTQAGV
jgi:ATP-binding cassette subfamily C protein